MPGYPAWVWRLRPGTDWGLCERIHQRLLDNAFQRDGAEPRLWVTRAMLQEATGAPRMAQASINYALAIWVDADPDYTEYQDALAIKARLDESGG